MNAVIQCALPPSLTNAIVPNQIIELELATAISSLNAINN
jgi:hypothetical protein